MKGEAPLPVRLLLLPQLGLPGERPERRLPAPPDQGRHDLGHIAVRCFHPHSCGILEGSGHGDRCDMAVLHRVVERLGIVPGVHIHQVFQGDDLAAILRLFLPLAVFIQIGPAAKVQIFRLAVVVLRELRHSQIPSVGRQLGPAVDSLSHYQHQEYRQDQRCGVSEPEGLCGVGHPVVPGLGLLFPAPPSRSEDHHKRQYGDIKAQSHP